MCSGILHGLVLGYPFESEAWVWQPAAEHSSTISSSSSLNPDRYICEILLLWLQSMFDAHSTRVYGTRLSTFCWDADCMYVLLPPSCLLCPQLPSPTLRSLCSVVRPHLATFSAPASCPCSFSNHA